MSEIQRSIDTPKIGNEINNHLKLNDTRSLYFDSIEWLDYLKIEQELSSEILRNVTQTWNSELNISKNIKELNISINELKELIFERITNRRYDDLKDKMDEDFITYYQEIITEILWEYNITDKKYLFDEWANWVILIIEEEKAVIKLPKRRGVEDNMKEKDVQEEFIEVINDWKQLRIDKVRNLFKNSKISQVEFNNLVDSINSIWIPNVINNDKIFIMEQIDAKSLRYLHIYNKIQNSFSGTVSKLWIDLESMSTRDIDSLLNIMNANKWNNNKEIGNEKLPSITNIQLDILDDLLYYLNNNGYYHNDLWLNDKNILLSKPQKNGLRKIYIIDFWESITPGINWKTEDYDKDNLRNMLKNFTK